ncbi:haloacid dehalogenase [Longimycelium tulufanense]|uniref:Haloacid dehalogenase n=1 Tax=Longimycelium tulufanense TaxID=907463 RepID=A0A8J3C796_9PSEU|nr:HAD family hydrolase [Longimycelium tulufanense]GGM47976.1 haloacid dehalogenase [Longimycelium tulufanense]
MEKPALVASDVDGTLLDPMERVRPRTAAAVRRVAAAGVPFVLVTGRPPRWVQPVARGVGVGGLAVCANGAVLYDAAEDRVLNAITLGPVLLQDAALALREAMPGCAFAVERITNGAGQFRAENRYRHFLAEPDYEHAWPDADSDEAPPAEVLGHPAIKLLVRHRDMVSVEMAAVARDTLGSAVDITFSTGAGLLELSPPGVTKGTGLAAVAGRLGVPAADVVAFGDMPNDLAMLAWAGHGVAMANAHPEVLAVADEITGPNTEDGVAQVLERWF